MRVKIKDYQAIKNAELNFDYGITSIVGESNNGKSSIIRAIEAAINNKGGSSFINYEADKCIVEIEDGENKIVWNKSVKSGKSSYEINGVELKKIGQKQIPEVAETLVMPEISVGTNSFRLNFWKQMDYPFLVGETSYQLFDFISNSKEQEIMFEMQEQVQVSVKENKTLIDSLNSKIDIKTEDIARAKQKAEKLEPIANFDIERLEKLISIKETIDKNVSIYEEAIDKISYLEKELLSINKNEKKANKSIEELSKSVASYESISKSIEDYERTSRSLYDSIETSKQYEESFKVYENKIAELEEISNQHSVVINLKSTIKKLLDEHELLCGSEIMHKTMLSEVEEELKEVESELSQFDECPICGSSLKNKE